MVDAIAAVICLTALIIGTLTDLRTREVPDWVNYSLIFIGIGYALINTIVLENYIFLLNSLAGLAFFFIIALVMFYTGQWGGGDSKMIMGIGAVMGLNVLDYPTWLIEPPFAFNFIVYSLICGAAYGLLWSIGIAVWNKKHFAKEFSAKLRDKLIVRIKKILVALTFAAVLASFFLHGMTKLVFLLIALLALLTFYTFIFIRSVEKACMLKYVKPEELTEGDWIAEEIKINGKYITGPKDLGIEKKKILSLIQLHKQGKIEKVLIKVGIPFVPSFLMAFILCIVLGWQWIAFISILG